MTSILPVDVSSVWLPVSLLVFPLCDFHSPCRCFLCVTSILPVSVSSVWLPVSLLVFPLCDFHCPCRCFLSVKRCGAFVLLLKLFSLHYSLKALKASYTLPTASVQTKRLKDTKSKVWTLFDRTLTNNVVRLQETASGSSYGIRIKIEKTITCFRTFFAVWKWMIWPGILHPGSRWIANVLISSEIGFGGRTIFGHIRLIECMGICVLSLAYGSELRRSDFICILWEKKSRNYSLNSATVRVFLDCCCLDFFSRNFSIFFLRGVCGACWLG